MGSREKDPRLQELKDKGITVYSFSRLETINNCLLAAYKQYILHEKGEGNIYSYMGTRVHDTLEAIMNGKATEKDLLPALHEELSDMEMSGVEFPKDKDGNDTLKNNWIKDMESFCTTYKRPKGDLANYKTEELFIYKSPKGHYLQGYIDLQHITKTGQISIYDYKTSSMYKDADLLSHGRQLVIYALGLRQAGCKVKSVAWIFLKYWDVTFMGKKTVKSKEKTLINKTIERRKLGVELEKYVTMDMEEAGYDDIDIDAAVESFKKSNDLNDLPKDIRKNYKLKPCIKQYDMTEDVIKETEEYVDNTIEMWESLSGEEKDYPHRDFWKTQKNGKKINNTFFCCSLCNYKMCDEVRDFLDQLEAAKEDDDDDLL